MRVNIYSGNGFMPLAQGYYLIQTQNYVRIWRH